MVSYFYCDVSQQIKNVHYVQLIFIFSTTISAPQIKTWYETTMESVKITKLSPVLFTNWECTGTLDIEKTPQLILINQENIEKYLTQTFAHHGLVDRPNEDNYIDKDLYYFDKSKILF